MGRPAARVGDPVAHPAPPALTPGPGSLNVFIGGMPAWRGVGAAAAAAIQSAKATSDAAIRTAEAATLAAAGTPGLPAAKTAEETTKSTAAASMGSMISSAAGGADIHVCATPLPIPPHGPGVVVDGSMSVFINGLPACRQGDTIVEAVGPPNKIVMGCPTVYIGDGGWTGAGAGLAGSSGIAADSSQSFSAPAPASDGVAPGGAPKISTKPTDEPLIGKSPTLERQIEALEKDGWSIKYWDGPGSDCNKASKTIRIDKNAKNDPKKIVQTLAHEVGHANYNKVIDASSREKYVSSNLADEGAATLNNIKVRREILSEDKNADIGTAGNPTNHKKYDQIYDAHLKENDFAKATREIGAVFGNGERTSTNNKSYNDYYGDFYDKNLKTK